MPTRKCDCCGKTKDVYGGKVCEKNGHFLCKDCAVTRGDCPLCGSKLH